MALTKINNNTLSAVTTLPAAIATGKVLQVVETRLTTVLSTTSSSWAATTGLNASITPSSTSNKVLILLNPTLSSANHGHMGLSRDGGSNFIGSGVSAGSRSGINFYAGIQTQCGGYVNPLHNEEKAVYHEIGKGLPVLSTRNP